MTTSEILLDAYERIRYEVHEVLAGAGPETLSWRPDPEANSMAWLIWHLARVQDDHLASAFDRPQVWHQDGWAERFGLPFDADDTGYGHSPEQVGATQAAAADLGGYHAAVAARTAELVGGVTDADMQRVVDRRWDPPVTLAVRLVSVIADCLQHAGQAAYIKGLADRAGVGPA